MSSILDFSIVLIVLILILSLMLMGYCSKIFKAYIAFPSINMFTYVIYLYLSRKIPKNVPVRAFMFQKFLSVAEQYKSEGCFLAWSIKPILFIYGPEYIKIFSSCTEKMREYDVIKEYFGNGLVTSSGETWQNHRKLLNPAFHTHMLKGKISLFDQHAKDLVKNLKDVKMDRIIILEPLKTCTFRIICDALFGWKLQEEKDKETIKKSLRLVTLSGECTIHRIVLPWLYYRVFLYFTAYGRQCLKLRKESLTAMNERISDIRESVYRSQHAAESEHLKSFGQILLEQHLKDPSFTKQDVFDELITFISAGYDTVAYSMMWCLFMLGHHSDIQERVFNEVEMETGELMTYDDVCKLKYLECVIKETLRLYPAIPVYGRTVKKDVQCGKYTVPKNTSIIFLTYALHRNPDIYPDPEKFIPERFLEENANFRSWEYTPFGTGIRECIGKKFAMLEMKVVLAHIIRHYKITSLDKRDDVFLSWDFVLAPLKPLHVELTERKKQLVTAK